MLDQLFGSATRVKVLNLFFNHEGGKFYTQEITKRLGTDIANTHRELVKLEKLNLLKSEKQANQKYYSLNESSKYYQGLKHLFTELPQEKEESIDEIFLKAFKKDWYGQGFNAYPLYLNRAGISGIEMRKVLGFGYTTMLYHYKNSYCEFHYLNDDLKNIWEQVKLNLKKDPQYIEKIAKQYYQIFSKHKKLFNQIDNLNLPKISNENLVTFLKETSQAMIDACGIAHAVEAIGIGAEGDFKQKLLDEIKDPTKFNEYYQILTTPSKRSFLSEEELVLKKLSLVSKNKLDKSLQEHLKKYRWVNNSYAGQAEVTMESLKKRLELLSKDKEKKQKISKNKLISKLSLTKEIKTLIELIDFTTIWQDQRKKNILISISYANTIVDEIIKRVGISKKAFYFMGINDVNNISSLEDIKKLERTLQERSDGSFFIHEEGKELVVSGKNYRKLLKVKTDINKIHADEEKDIHGSIANKGTAIGKVVICKDLDSIKRVEVGDVVVASMTRPEFMPALKKAVAIVTDEGGVTCHAAIISRELGIPAIIGTKIATKVLHDGMQIEVRANHGIVRVIS